MEMISEQLIEASRESVWLALNDTAILQQAMPGCESFEETGENTFEARLVTKIGPVKARFKFDVSLSDLDPPRGYTISGAGQGVLQGLPRGRRQSLCLNKKGQQCWPIMCRPMWVESWLSWGPG